MLFPADHLGRLLLFACPETINKNSDLRFDCADGYQASASVMACVNADPDIKNLVNIPDNKGHVAELYQSVRCGYQKGIGRAK